jgi:hypothetical protein
MTTRIQFASKLLSAAYSAGLLAGNRDPRAVVFPRVPDDALEYLMYLLREVTFEGTLLSNPYTPRSASTAAPSKTACVHFPAFSLQPPGRPAELRLAPPHAARLGRRQLPRGSRGMSGPLFAPARLSKGPSPRCARTSSIPTVRDQHDAQLPLRHRAVRPAR